MAYEDASLLLSYRIFLELVQHYRTSGITKLYLDVHKECYNLEQQELLRLVKP